MRLLQSLRYLFFSSKTLPFIAALIVSYRYVEITVVYPLMYYLVDYNLNQQIAAIVINLQDALSSIFLVIISLISEAYTGCFTMITLCTASSIQGLMLLWKSTATSSNGEVYAAIFFLALGESGLTLSINFLENQLQQKKKEQDPASTLGINIWLVAPSIATYIMVVNLDIIDTDKTYEESFRFAALLMGGTFLFFLFGSPGYRHEKLPAESNLHKIYRICKAGLRKRKSKYPASEDCYYWKDHKQCHLYMSKNGEGLRLYPRVPRLFRWLDKAAAIVNVEDSRNPEMQEKNGQLCTVKDVREVKSLVPMIYLSFAFFAYNLLMASGKTFFTAQISTFNNRDATANAIVTLSLIKSGSNKMSRFICFIIHSLFRCFRKFKNVDGRSMGKAGTILRIGFGMLCAIICCVIAWHVEKSRLQVNKKAGDHRFSDKNLTEALAPQYLLLGVTEGFVDGGLSNLFRGQVVEEMQSFEDSFIQLVYSVGKLLIIPFVFSSWIKDANNSRLDRYYMMLAILNAVLLVGFGYYSIRYAYRGVCPKDEKITVEERLEHGPQPHSQDFPYQECNNKVQPVEQEIDGS